MKKQLLPLFLAGATFVSTASAADFGIGVSLSDNRTIYVPIEINNDLRVEPFLAHTNSEWALTTITTVERTDTTIGAGVFAKSKRSPSMLMYYGGRFAIINFEQTQTTTTVGGTTSTTVDGNGFRIAPTAGMEYVHDKKFSVGGEVSVYYQDVEDESSNGTATQLILRYYF